MLDDPERPKFTLIQGGGEGGPHNRGIRAASHLLRSGNLPLRPEQQLEDLLHDIAASPYLRDGDIFPVYQALLFINLLTANLDLTPEEFIRRHVQVLRDEVTRGANIDETVKQSMILLADGLELADETFEFIGEQPFNKARQEEYLSRYAIGDRINRGEGPRASDLWKNDGLQQKMLQALVVTQRLTVLAADSRPRSTDGLIEDTRKEIFRQVFDYDLDEPLEGDEWMDKEYEINETRLNALNALLRQKRAAQGSGNKEDIS